MFSEVVHQGQWNGVPGSPSAFEMNFGWVLTGEASPIATPSPFLAHHTTVDTGDELLCKLWEIEQQPSEYSGHSPEERSVTQHFKDHHSRNNDDRFIVPLPKKPHVKPLGESHLQAVKRHKSLVRSLQSRGAYNEFHLAMEEYFEMTWRSQHQKSSICPCILSSRRPALRPRYVQCLMLLDPLHLVYHSMTCFSSAPPPILHTWMC